MLNNKLNGYIFHSYIKAKSMNIAASKSIVERAILVDGAGKTTTVSYSCTGKKEGKPSLVKK